MGGVADLKEGMKKADYEMIEEYMIQCMADSAHDKEHVYRVLYIALDIANYEKEVDFGVLITACLLHDIARKEQFENPQLCHAVVGAVKAYDFLIKKGFDVAFANKVANCIRVHRYRSHNHPETIEEKILFDADKIDATGTLGIARTLLYKGKLGESLYSVNEAGEVLNGAEDRKPSFFQEYKLKLERLYSKFYTKRGFQIAMERQHAAIAFYENMHQEVQDTYRTGGSILSTKFF